MMEKITMLYMDDKIDPYVSKYLNSYKHARSNIEYIEYAFNKDLYENLIENKNVTEADILILDSMLFENSNVESGKITGEELGLIIRKVFPFKEIIIVTQHKNKLSDDIILNKYNSLDHKCEYNEFFEKNWQKLIDKSIDIVLLNRTIMHNISNKPYIERYFLERIKDSLNGIASYSNLNKEDIDRLVDAFEEMRKMYDKQ